MNKKLISRILVIAAGVVAIILFFHFDLKQYLSLTYIKESQTRFLELYESNSVLVVSIYMLIYIGVTALSLPGAVFLTLAGGALFGLWKGVVIVSFASTIGATLACGVSRFLLQDWVQNRFGDKLQTINEGIEKEGSFYLFTLRLIPYIPFFVINLVMGLTKMPLLKFFWVSQIGMLAGTFVYINAGKELSKIESIKDIVSPGLIISFALLGLFPITVKKVMELYRRKFMKDDLGGHEND